MEETKAEGEYDFNCPQFTDFSNVDGDGFPEFENDDGYFAMRRSSIGMDKVPQQWLKQMNTGDVENNENRDSNASELPKPPTKKIQQESENLVCIDTWTPPAPPAAPQSNELSKEKQHEAAVLVPRKAEVTSQEAEVPPKKVDAKPASESNVVLGSTVDVSIDSLEVQVEQNVEEVSEQEEKVVTSSVVDEKPSQSEKAEEPSATVQPQEVKEIETVVEEVAPKPALVINTAVPSNIVRAPAKSIKPRAPRPASPRYANATKSFHLKRRSSYGKRDRSNSPKISTMKRNKPLALTQPHAPKFTSRKPSRAPMLSSTTLELEKIAQEKARYDELRLQEKQKLASMPSSGHPVTKPLTQPKTPKLRSSMRSRAVAKHEVEAPKPRPTATGPGPLKVTRPEPFDLSRGRQEAVKSEAKFEPVAVKVQKFHNKTPSRFRHRRQASPIKAQTPMHLTEPMSVKLATRSRSRKSNVMSKADQEKLFMSSVKPFKARPLQRKIMQSSGDLGVPKVEKKQPCKPKEFRLQTDSRASKRQSLTSNKTRRASSPMARSVGVRSKSSQVSHSRVRPSTPEPFKLKSQQRHEQAKLQMERRLEAEREAEEKKRHFKARPLPVFNPQPVVLSEHPLTEPVTPMALVRSQELAKRRAIELERKEENRKRLSMFKAKGLPYSTYEKDFSPQLPHAAVVPSNVVLRSDVRANKRFDFEVQKRQKEEQERADRERKEVEKKAAEDKELREYRKTLGHKALPLPYKSSRVQE